MTNNTQIANWLIELDSKEDHQDISNALKVIRSEAPEGTAQLIEAFIKVATNNSDGYSEFPFSEDQVSILERVSYELFEMDEEDNYDNTYDRPGAYEEDA